MTCVVQRTAIRPRRLLRRGGSCSAARRALRRSRAAIIALDVAAEHDVGAAAGHVGGDGDHRRAPGLRDDLGLALRAAWR
jgi:hypothetical protein